MDAADQYLTVPPLPTKFDRTYRARARDTDAVYQVNLARLQCTCPDFESRRAGFAPADARRVCEHIYDKLYATKAERSFDLILQLFIRYGRSMYSYRIVADDIGRFVLGQPFGARSIRAIGVVGGNPVLATYNVDSREWSTGETDLSPKIAADILARMRTAFPEAFTLPNKRGCSPDPQC